MIYDSIKNMENYKDYPVLYRILNFLREITPEKLPDPGTTIIKGVAFCNPVIFTSKEEKDCVYEAHKKYIDLHYIIKGAEKIRTADVVSLTTQNEYSTENDIQFFSGTPFGTYTLKPGDFMVCYPSDAHKVAIAPDIPAEITKVVVKIKF